MFKCFFLFVFLKKDLRFPRLQETQRRCLGHTWPSIHGYESSDSSSIIGVPQGSTLGPLFFVCFLTIVGYKLDF